MNRLSALALAVLAGSVQAQSIYYVNGTCGDNTWSGLSPLCAAPDGPKRTIQAAITAAADDDTVLVADGVYSGFGNTNMSFGGKRLVLRSQGGPAGCIIDMQGSGRAFGMADYLTPATAVDGFTIRNGRGQPGGAFWFHHRSDATIRNCIITGNSSVSWGGAVHTETDAQPTFESCTFVGNTAAQGGAMSITQASRPSIINCVFIGNSASDRGGAIVIIGSPGAALVNCTIAGNSASNRGGGLSLDAGSTTLRNSILWNNAAPAGSQAAVGLTGVLAAGNLNVAYSIIQGDQSGILLEGAGALTWLAGNLALDPLFVDPAVMNFRLRAGSPAIDAADNTALPAGILTDRDGRPRFVDDPPTPNTGIPGGAGGNAIADIGAYEFPGTCYPNCDASTTPPTLNISDFTCFLNRFAAGDPYANCDGSTTPPVLNVADFTCFLNTFAAGCSVP